MKPSVSILIGIFVAFFSACEQKDPVLAMKEELKGKKTEMQKLKISISELEKEL